MMNEPIISPWLIYVLGIASDVKRLMIAIAIICGIMIFILFLFGKIEDEKVSIKWGKLLIIPCIISSLLAVTIPDRNTLIGMIVASKITPASLTEATKAGKDFKEGVKKDIIDVIEAFKKDQEKK